MLQFVYNGSSYEVIGQIEPFETNIEIPAEYDDGINGIAPVTSIGSGAFRGQNIESVIFPEYTLQRIGLHAFRDNQITDLSIVASGLNIGPTAFRENQIRHLTIIGDNITLDASAFNTNNLSTVTLEIDGSLEIPSLCFANNDIDTLTIASEEVVILLTASAFNSITSMLMIVPEHLEETYKTAPVWSDLYNQGRIIFDPPIPELKDFREVGSIYLDSYSKNINRVSLVTEDTINRIKNQEEESEKGVLYISNKKSTVTPNRIENGDNTQFVDTASDNVSIDLRPSLLGEDGSESGRIKLARNFFELYAEKMGLGSKYIYHLTTKDNGSIEIVVGDTNSELGQETYSFDFTSRENTNQVARVKELQDAVDTIADMLGVL